MVTGNLPINSNAYAYTKNIASRYPNVAFPDGWKANIEGVDLNLQFPARMGKCKENKVFTRIYNSCSS